MLKKKSKLVGNFDTLFQSAQDKGMQERLSQLLTILGGETTIFLHLQFLIKSNKTDMLILKNTKVTLLFKN